MRKMQGRIKKRVFVGVPKRQRKSRWFSRAILESQKEWLHGWYKRTALKRKGRRAKLLRRLFETKFFRTMIGTALIVVFALNVAVRDSVGGSFGLSPKWENGEQKSFERGPEVVVTEKGMQPPLSQLKINQGFSFFHKGVDLDGETGDEVRPVEAGVVETVDYWRYAYGNHIIVNHGSGFKSLYAHLSRVNVKEGDEVDKTTVIGQVGTTGWSTGSHLHLELRVNEETVNPLIYLR